MDIGETEEEQNASHRTTQKTTCCCVLSNSAGRMWEVNRHPRLHQVLYF